MMKRGTSHLSEADQAFESRLGERRYTYPVSFREFWTDVRGRIEAERGRRLSVSRWIARTARVFAALSAAAAVVLVVTTGFLRVDNNRSMVTMIRGGVETRIAGTAGRPSLLMENLSRQTVLKTDRGGECEIQIARNALVDLDENSEIEIVSLPHENRDGSTQIRLFRGRITIRSFSYKMDREFVVLTRLAVVSATGSRSTITTEADGDIRVAVQDGSVKVEPEIGGQDAWNPGQKTALEKILAPVTVPGGKSVLIRKKSLDNIRNHLPDTQSLSRLDPPMILRGLDRTDREKLNTLPDAALMVRPESGSVAKVGFESRPDRASVTVRRQAAGKTPFTRLLETDRTLSVTAEKKGYRALTTNITVQKDGVVSLDLGQQQDTGSDPSLTAAETPAQGTDLTERVKRSRGVFSEDSLIVSYRNSLSIYRDGRTARRVTVGSSSDSRLTKPLIVRDRVIVGSESGGLYAFSTAGDLLWSRRDAGRASPSATPAAGGNMIFLPTADKGIEVYSRDGTPLREIIFEKGGGVFTTPYYNAKSDILVFRNAMDRLVAYDMGYHNILWSSTEVGDRPLSALAGNNESVFAIFRDTGEISAFHLKTGRVLWKKAVMARRGSDISATADAAWIYVVIESDRTTRFEVLNAKSGWLEFAKDWSEAGRPRLVWDGYRMQAVSEDGTRSDYDPVVRAFQ